MYLFHEELWLTFSLGLSSTEIGQNSSKSNKLQPIYYKLFMKQISNIGQSALLCSCSTSCVKNF